MDDDIANEGDERFTLNYVHNNGLEFVDVVENLGEFLRHTATVIIIDNDCKELSTNYIPTLGCMCTSTMCMKMMVCVVIICTGSNDFINIPIWSLSAVAMMGLEKTFYQFSEGSNETNVCIEVFGSDSHCPVNFSITVNLTTSDGTAGI